MGGLASLIAGFGHAAHQQHMQDQEIETGNKKALSQMITSLASRATPEEIPQLLQMNADIYGSKKPISKSDIPFRIMTTAAGMQQRRMQGSNPSMGTQFPPQGQPSAGGAGGASGAQGTGAARTPLDSMMSSLPGSEAGKGIMPATPDVGPPGQLPGTSPVQPAQQGGGSSPMATFRNTHGSLPVPISGVPAPDGSGGPQAQPVQSQGFEQFRQLANQTDPAYLPALEHALQTYVQPQVQNAAELARAKELAHYQLTELGPEKVHMLQNLPGYKNLPPMIQGMSEAEALGVPLRVPFGAYTPQAEHTTAGALTPEQVQQFGRGLEKMDPREPITVMRDKMSGNIVDAYPGAIQLQNVAGWNGQGMGLNKFTGGADALTGVAAPSTAATTRTGTSLGFENINGQIVPVQKPTSQTTQKVPGAGAAVGGNGGGGGSVGAGGATPRIPPVHPNGGGSVGAPATPAGPSVRTGAPLGDSQATFHMRAENPLTAPGQSMVASGTNVLKQVDRALDMLKNSKDDNTPGWASKVGLSKALYKLGISDDNSNLINSIELQRLMEAGVLLKATNGSRAFPVLEAALVHTPGTLNSPKLMYEKLLNIKQNIQDSVDEANKYMKKYPGLPPVGGSGASSGGMVTMRAPNGATKQVSADAVDHYKSLGAVVVQ